jgi:hypothetical protein
MRGVAVIAVNPRDASRLLRFLVDAPYTDPEIGQNSLRARAAGYDMSDSFRNALWKLATADEAVRAKFISALSASPEDIARIAWGLRAVSLGVTMAIAG